MIALNRPQRWIHLYLVDRLKSFQHHASASTVTGCPQPIGKILISSQLYRNFLFDISEYIIVV